MPDSLKAYREKRRFERTPEPSGASEPEPSKFPVFVVQLHDARRKHYDFRLECQGVLKSWAVTREPTLDPAVKRLAIRTEDHPRDYAEFEGIIPEGEYGAGPVIVWDYGVFVNETQKHGRPLSLEVGVGHGHVSVFLQGMKLAGRFALTRFKEEGGKEQWLFVKSADEHAKPGETRWDPKSVLTGRTLEDVVAGRGGRREWRGKERAATTGATRAKAAKPK